MKRNRMVAVLAVMVVCAFVAAMTFAGGDKEHIQLSGVYSGAVSTATSPALNGYIEQIYISVPVMTTWTGVVSIATSTNRGAEVLYTNTITANTMIRPFVNRGNSAGTLSNVTSRVFMYGDPLKISVTVTSTGTVGKVVDALVWTSDY